MRPPTHLGIGLLLAFSSLSIDAKGATDITAVAARASDAYVRTKGPDGAFPVEYYAFGNGGHYGGQMADDSVDKLKFMDVARMLAEPLAASNFLPARDPAKTRLLIMVYWGLTFVPESISASSGYNNFSSITDSTNLSASLQRIHASTQAGAAPLSVQSSGSSALEVNLRDDQLAALSSALTELTLVNDQRDQIDFSTANLLGYDYDAAVGTEHGNYIRGTAFALKRDDLVSEIESNRYFVVLMAYDFQKLLKEKQHTLLWEARFSVRQSDHAFDRDLPMMARFASHYFGQNTYGLVRQRIPFGNVTIGDVQSLGTVETSPSK